MGEHHGTSQLLGFLGEEKCPKHTLACLLLLFQKRVLTLRNQFSITMIYLKKCSDDKKKKKEGQILKKKKKTKNKGRRLGAVLV